VEEFHGVLAISGLGYSVAINSQKELYGFARSLVIFYKQNLFSRYSDLISHRAKGSTFDAKMRPQVDSKAGFRLVFECACARSALNRTR